MENISDKSMEKIFENIRDMFSPLTDFEDITQLWKENFTFMSHKEIKTLSKESELIIEHLSLIIVILMKFLPSSMQNKLRTCYMLLRRLDFQFGLFPCSPFLTNVMIEEVKWEDYEILLCDLINSLKKIHDIFI